MQRYMETFKNFQKWNPELINQMRNCSHHYDSENLSPYHIENDVWTHTVLMYRDFMEISSKITNRDIALNDILDCLSIIILCHDIGKVYTRHVPNNQYGKIAFYNHPFASVQKTMDFIEYLNRFQDGFNMDNAKIHSVLNVVSNHMDVHNIIDASIGDDVIEKKMSIANYDFFIYGLTQLLNLFDKRNSMDNNLGFLDKSYSQDDMIKALELYRENRYISEFNVVEKYDITVYCGVPACGKDHISNNDNDVTLSYDDIRVSLYLEHNPDDSVLKQSEIYTLAWEWCNKQNIDLNTYLKAGVIDAIKSGKTVGIANTNLSRKARRSLANLLSDYKIRFMYVGCVSGKLVYRNNSRDSKKLDRLVMNKFIYNQQIPCMWEFEKCKNVIDIDFVMN